MILIDLFDTLRGIFKRRQVANMLCAENGRSSRACS